MNIIGIVTESCFVEKWSTPRQGRCVEDARATITIYNEAIWDTILSDIHHVVIVIFVFHLNNDTERLIGGQKFARLKSKVNTRTLTSHTAIAAVVFTRSL